MFFAVAHNDPFGAQVCRLAINFGVAAEASAGFKLRTEPAETAHCGPSVVDAETNTKDLSVFDSANVVPFRTGQEHVALSLGAEQGEDREVFKASKPWLRGPVFFRVRHHHPFLVLDNPSVCSCFVFGAGREGDPAFCPACAVKWSAASRNDNFFSSGHLDRDVDEGVRDVGADRVVCARVGTVMADCFSAWRVELGPSEIFSGLPC